MVAPHYYRHHFRHTPSEMSQKMMFYARSGGSMASEPTHMTNRSENSFFDYQIQYVVRGKGSLHWNNHCYKLGAGDTFFIDLSRNHMYYPDPEDPWEVQWIRFGGHQVKDYYKILEVGDDPVRRIYDKSSIESYFHAMHRIFTERPITFEFQMSTVISGLLVELINAKWCPPVDTHSGTAIVHSNEIQTAIRYMEENYNAPIQLENIMAQVRISRFYFSRLFKHATGFTILEYLHKCRVTKAKELLSGTSLPIGHIAEAIGFQSQSYFGKIFSRYERMTPKEYRALNSASN